MRGLPPSTTPTHAQELAQVKPPSSIAHHHRLTLGRKYRKEGESESGRENERGNPNIRKEREDLAPKRMAKQAALTLGRAKKNQSSEGIPSKKKSREDSNVRGLVSAR